MSKFLTPLKVQLVDGAAAQGRGTWQLLEDLVYQSDAAGATFSAPAGFITDFESVPRIPGVFELLGDLYSQPAAMHDWLYCSHPCDRETADKVLREAILATGGSSLHAALIFQGVRAFGESHWNT